MMEKQDFLWNNILLIGEADFIGIEHFPTIDVNLLDQNGQSVWQWVLENEWQEGLEALLKQGHDPNVYPETTELPLAIAVMLSQKEMVELLVRYEADPHEKSRFGKNSIAESLNEWSAISGNSIDKPWEIVTLLMDHPKTDLSQPYDGNMSLAQIVTQILKDNENLSNFDQITLEEKAFFEKVLQRHEAKQLQQQLDEEIPEIKRHVRRNRI